jgi:hypothetical protein
MTIANMSDPNTMTGAPVTVSNREKLGRVDAIYFDNATDKPEWAAVKSGLFASRVALVPLAQGTWNNGTLTVPFGTDALKAAPRRDLTGSPTNARPSHLDTGAKTADSTTNPSTPTSQTSLGPARTSPEPTRRTDRHPRYLLDQA